MIEVLLIYVTPDWIVGLLHGAGVVLDALTRFTIQLAEFLVMCILLASGVVHQYRLRFRQVRKSPRSRRAS